MHITVYSPIHLVNIPIDWLFTNTFYDCLKNDIHLWCRYGTVLSVSLCFLPLFRT
jgi:hypothetical protein